MALHTGVRLVAPTSSHGQQRDLLITAVSHASYAFASPARKLYKRPQCTVCQTTLEGLRDHYMPSRSSLAAIRVASSACRGSCIHRLRSLLQC